MKGLVSLAVFFSLIFFGAQYSLVEAATIGMKGQNSTVQVGEKVSVQLLVGGLTGDPEDSLSGFDLDISYDPSILGFNTYSFIDYISGINQLNFSEPGGFPFFEIVLDFFGTIDVFAVSGNSGFELDSSQNTSFSFLTLDFIALEEVTQTTVSLDLADPFLLFSNSVFDVLSVSFGSTQVVFMIGQYTDQSGSRAVPEPGTMLLVFLGVVSIFFLGKRKAKYSM